MNLLPKAREEFATKSYWDNFFKKRKNAFEWYGEYSQLCGVLHKYCKPIDKVLMVGCGNSRLSEDMYDVGYHDIVNIDISDLVIRQMINKNQKKRSKMKYLKMDIKETTFDDGEYNVVIDKGTLDALFTDNEVQTVAGIKNMFNEIHRTLCESGRYICITLAQAHILQELLSYFSASWLVHVHRIESMDTDSDEGLGGKLPVFAFVFTKMITTLSSPILEMSLSEDFKIQKFNTLQELKMNIENLQGYAIIQNKLEHSCIDDIVTVDLWGNDSKCQEPRYSLTVVDTAKSELSTYNGKFAIFIVPQGLESEHIYADDSGQRSLSAVAGFSRLIIASLHRGHKYKNLDEIKSELSEKVMELAPPGLSKATQVPFLTASSDIGSREVQYENASPKYGGYLVEDIQSTDQYYYRQLIFRNNLNVVQTQARLMLDKSSKRKIKLKKRVVDHRYLMTPYYKAMLAGLTLVNNLNLRNPGDFNVLLLGLRGGCFISFLLELFPEVQVTCVEQDQSMIDVAETYFQLPTQCERLRMVVTETSEYLATNLKQAIPILYDVIIMDNRAKNEALTNNNDITKQILFDINSSLKNAGLFMRHEVNHKEKEIGPPDMVTVFSSVFQTELGDDSSNILYLSSSGDTAIRDDLVSMSQRKLKELQTVINEKRKGFYAKNEWDLLCYIESMRKISE